jgi:hypothetical protein
LEGFPLQIGRKFIFHFILQLPLIEVAKHRYSERALEREEDSSMAPQWTCPHLSKRQKWRPIFRATALPAFRLFPLMVILVPPDNGPLDGWTRVKYGDWGGTNRAVGESCSEWRGYYTFTSAGAISSRQVPNRSVAQLKKAASAPHRWQVRMELNTG